MNIIEKLKWRYAVKKFDTRRKLTNDQLAYLLEAINLAPTSYGLQPFKVLLVEDKAIREKLKAQAWGQGQVTDASQLIIFAAQTKLSAKDVDAFVANISKTRNIPVEGLAEYEGMMKNTIQSRTPEQLTQWAARQAYIALGFLLSAAASANIDACPMEGFSNEAFDDLLGLKEKGLTSVVMATVGYRSEDDGYQNLAKVRKPLEEIIIKY